ncbi:MAG: pentapeptide repeat-containing protein [Bacteroidetes bacterium]|nr:pentapeptide repeat-containing protein [Bacteroidota bacterium]
MQSFQSINSQTKEGLRTLDRLLTLRLHLDQQIPQRNLEDTLILGTWNIREFDSPSFGKRIDEAMLYIAEIVRRFDLVAIQEVRKDLSALNRLVELLGRDRWSYVFTDVTEGSAGNMERMAFLYDTRKVTFGGLASEIVLPPMKVKDEDGKTQKQAITQVARTPFMVGFNSGDTSFILVSVHILYGSSKADDEERVLEIKHVAEFLRDRAYAPTTWSKNIALLGDFNIFDPGDLTMQALTGAGFKVPPELQNLPSNFLENKFYDQIAFYNRDKGFATTGKAGVFNFFKHVFRAEDEAEYVEEMGDNYWKNSRGKERDEDDRNKYYMNYWRTHQMSDHLPMWVELKINFKQDYLVAKYQEAKAGQSKTRGMSLEKKILIDDQEKAIPVKENGRIVLENFEETHFADRDLSKAPLAGMDLREKDFSRATFREAILDETNFNFSNMEEASFERTDLLMTSFYGANLTCANFYEASLFSINFFEADLTGASFAGARVERCNFDDAVLDGTTWDGAEVEEKLREVLEKAGVETRKVSFF